MSANEVGGEVGVVAAIITKREVGDVAWHRMSQSARIEEAEIWLSAAREIVDYLNVERARASGLARAVTEDGRATRNDGWCSECGRKYPTTPAASSGAGA